MKHISKKILLPTLTFVAICSFGLFSDTAFAAVIPKPTNMLGLAGWWKLDEGTGSNVEDSGPYKNAGTISGATWTPGRIGANALNFTHTSSHYVSMGAPSVLNIVGNITMSAWINLNSFPTSGDPGCNPNYCGYIVAKGFDGSNESYQMRYEYNSSGGTYTITIGAYQAAGNQGYGTSWPITFSAGTWHHVVGQYDGSNWVIYVDGVRVSSTAGASGARSGSANVSIGAGFINGSPSRFFPGKIDDVRIYSRALSQTEVYSLYRYGNESKINTTKSPGTLTSSLVGHWTFDGKDMTPNVRDISGQGNHGNLSGQTSTTTVIGKVGQALNSDGVNDFVNVPTAVLTSGPVTFTGWIYKASTASTNYVVASIGNNSHAQRNVIYLTAGSAGSAKIEVLMFINGSFGAHSSTGNLSANTWTHVAGIYNPTTGNVDLYINGVFDSSGSTGLTGYPTGMNTTKIGALVDNDGTSDSSWLGYLDDIRIYNRALSAAEIKQLYTMGESKFNTTQSPGTLGTSGLVGHWTFDGKNMTPNVRDISGQGNHGNLVGQTSTTTAIGKIGQALSFDGVNDRVSISPSQLIDPSVPYSISFWVKALPFGESAIYAEGSATGDLILIESNPGADTEKLRIYLTQNSVLKLNVQSSQVVRDGKWHHVVFVDNSGSARLYVDAVLDGSDFTYTPQARGGSMTGAFLGTVEGTYGFFKGDLDDVRVYHRALTTAEIQQLYTMGK